MMNEAIIAKRLLRKKKIRRTLHYTSHAKVTNQMNNEIRCFANEL